MKTVLITGASRGIGKATAEKFLVEGWFVIGTSTSGKVGIDSPNFSAVALDLSKSESIVSAVSEIKKLGKQINVLINNAGINVEEWEEKVLDIQKLRKTLDVNVVGTTDFTEQMLVAFGQIKHIIVISSLYAALNEENDAYNPAYRMSKTALNMYARTLATRLSGKTIVSAVDPGWVKTDMGGAEAPRNPEEPAEEIYNLAISDVETGQFWLNGKKREW